MCLRIIFSYREDLSMGGCKTTNGTWLGCGFRFLSGGDGGGILVTWFTTSCWQLDTVSVVGHCQSRTG